MSVSHKRVVVSSSNAHHNSTPVFSFSLAGWPHTQSLNCCNYAKQIPGLQPLLYPSLDQAALWKKIHEGEKRPRQDVSRPAHHTPANKQRSSQALRRSDFEFLKGGVFLILEQDGVLECVRVP